MIGSPLENPAFRRWFGDSVVVDENGEPLVVYHGTTAGKFGEFRPHIRKGESLGFGIHFSEDFDFANRYAIDSEVARKGRESFVFSVYLKSENPLVANGIAVEGTPEFELAKKLAGKKIFTQLNEEGRRVVWLQSAINATSPERAQKLIVESGYDSVRYDAALMRRSAYGVAIVTGESQAWVVFDPRQIKSATDNDGGFDPENPDVRKNPPRSEPHPGNPLENPAFRRWFGDSVVADKDGEPLVVYHGGFDVVGSEAGAFRPGRALGKWGPGIYFTPLEYRARWYAEDNEGVVGAYYLRMGRPLVVLESQAYDPNVEGIIRQARQIGTHDGVIVLDGTNTRNVRFDRNVTEIIVFDPKQVKAAFDNDGSFDPENPDVKKNPPGRTFIPPQKVADEAVYGLYLRSQMPPSSRCCTPVGLARAKQLKNREPVSVETLKRMRSYFQRHAVDKKGARWAIDSKGFQAWLLWGGDSGRDWCNRTLEQLRE